MNGVHESMRAHVDAVAASMGDGGPDRSEKAPAGAATLAQAPSRPPVAAALMYQLWAVAT